jgi:transcriptional regulator with XRE-family HTH domain
LHGRPVSFETVQAVIMRREGDSVTDIGSTVPKRQLGRYLKEAREKAGLSLEAAARRLEWSKAKMYRIEGGENSLRTLDVIGMCSVYGVDSDLTEVLVALAAETKSKGWWESYGDTLPDWFELYVGLEGAATHLRHYEPGLIPGLLQTREYAAAIIATGPEITDAEVQRRVALRLERQSLLTRHVPRAPQLDVVLEEAVLRRSLADRTAMASQLAHLASPRANVSVRVVPSAVGPHRALVAGAFVILEFPEEGNRRAEPTTVYSEGLTGALYLDKEREVAAFEAAWEKLNALALSPKDSIMLIEKIKKEHDGAQPD